MSKEDLLFIIKANIRDYERKMDKAAGAMQKATGRMARYGKRLKSISRGFSSMAKGATIAAAAVTAATVAVFGFTKKAAEAIDTIQKMSDRLGVTTEFLSELAHAADLGGASIEDIEAAMRRMARTASDADEGLSTALRTFKNLGIEVKDAGGQLKTTEALFWESAEALSNLTDATKKTALAQELWGRGGTKLLPMINQGTAAIKAQMEEAKFLGLSISELTGKMGADFVDAQARAEAAMKGVTLTIANEMMPEITQMMNDFSRWAREHPEDVKAIAEAFGEIPGAVKAVGRSYQWLVNFSADVMTPLLIAPRDLGDAWEAAKDAADKYLSDAPEPPQIATGDAPAASPGFDTDGADAATEAVKKSLDERFEAYLEETRSEEQVLNDSTDKQFAILREFYVGGLLSDAEYLDAKKLGSQEYEDFMIDQLDRLNAEHRAANGILGEDYAEHLEDRAELDELYNIGHLEGYMEMLDQKFAADEAALEGVQEFMDVYTQMMIDSQINPWKLVAEASDAAFRGISSNISAMIMGTKSASDAIKDMGKAMVQAVVDYAAETIAANIVSKAMMVAFGIASAIEAAAVAAAWAPAAAMVSLASWGANAKPAMAGIAATVALAEALAGVTAAGGAAGGAAEGAGSGVVMAADGGIFTGPTLALIGEGSGPEMVLPLDRAKDFGFGGDGGFTIEGDVIIYSQATNGAELYDEFMAEAEYRSDGAFRG